MTAIVTATRVFIGTNLDDLIVLTVLMPAHRAHGKPRSRQIWAGQYLGIGALVAVSVLAALSRGNRCFSSGNRMSKSDCTASSRNSASNAVRR